MKNITGLMVVYKTLDYLEEAYNSFRKFYPKVKLVIVDNSEGDECTEFLKESLKLDDNLEVLFMERNVGHGLGLHAGIEHIKTKYIYFFDSDTKMLKGGLLEKLIDEAKAVDNNFYVISKTSYVDRGGRDIRGNDDSREKVKWAYGYATLLNRKKYFEYPPLTKYGLCILKAYVAIHDEGRGEELIRHFPVDGYVKHAWGGTRARYGDCEKIVK